MNIAIIGGGWVGCHLAYKLKKNHNISLFEKNEELFTETSYNNQNRLHYGFHYPRNYKTRELCKTTFHRFLYEYGFLTENIEKNLYCVPEIKSNIDYLTYLQIFNDYDITETSNSHININNCISVDERYINFDLAKKFFNQELKDVFVAELVTNKKLKSLSKNYDLVINATNNQIKNNDSNSFYELTLSLIYKKIKDVNFGALTLVDGPFFSIYPYNNDLYSLTDVEHTPIKKFKNINNLNKFKENIKIDLIENKRRLMENKVIEYFPEYLKYFQYDSYYFSTKSKIISSSDERYPVMMQKNNIINCFTGKIQGIFIIEERIKNIINDYA